MGSQAPRHTNIDKEKKENMEKRKLELQTIIEKQDDRVNHLQTKAFELANYYFVFQGLLLGAVVNATSLLRCSDRWFLFSLSLIAGILNLVALLVIGVNYKKRVLQRSRTRCEFDQLVSDLGKLDTSPSDQRLKRDILSYWIQTNSELELPTSTSSAPTRPHEPEQRQCTWVVSRYGSIDIYKELLRDFYYILCMALFVSFAILVVVGCWTIPCKKALQCTPPVSNISSDKCIRFCEGAKCVSICTEN